LNKIVGMVAVPAKRNGEGTKPRHCRQHGSSDGRLQRPDLFFAWTVEIGCIDQLDLNLLRDPPPPLLVAMHKRGLPVFAEIVA
jgi:hypothetical protein